MRYDNQTTTSLPMFDHEKLHVYQVGLEFVAFSAKLAKELKGEFRSTRDQLIRSSQSIVLNIAEGNGKRSDADRKRFFEIARGSATESAATSDVIVACGVITQEVIAPGKVMLIRIVSMLSRMTETEKAIAREDAADYYNSIFTEIIDP